VDRRCLDRRLERGSRTGRNHRGGDRNPTPGARGPSGLIASGTVSGYTPPQENHHMPQRITVRIEHDPEAGVWYIAKSSLFGA
jgi:hypothetical protein